MLKFRCGQCRQKIGVPAEYAGKRVRCPRCQQPSAVPFPGEIVPQVEAMPLRPVPPAPVVIALSEA